MTNEEIDQKLAEIIKGHKDHIHLIDGHDSREFHHVQCTWEELFKGIEKDGLPKFLVIVKHKDGPVMVWEA